MKTLLFFSFFISLQIYSQDNLSIKVNINNCQEYNRNILFANKYLNSKVYDSAMIYFEKAFEFKDYINAKDRVGLAKLYAIIGKKDESFTLLFDIISDEIPYKLEHNLFETDDFKNLKDDDRWLTFGELLKNKKMAANENYDSSLDTIFENDQKFRKQLSNKTQLMHDSITEKLIWENIKKNDSINLSKIDELIDGNIKKKFSQREMSIIFLVIQHSNIETQHKYFDFLTAAYSNGVLTSSNYATFVDRISLQDNGFQIYGTQVYFDKNDKIYKYFRIENEETVNDRRREMCLMSIQDYMRYWNN